MPVAKVAELGKGAVRPARSVRAPLARLWHGPGTREAEIPVAAEVWIGWKFDASETSLDAALNLARSLRTPKFCLQAPLVLPRCHSERR